MMEKIIMLLLFIGYVVPFVIGFMVSTFGVLINIFNPRIFGLRLIVGYILYVFALCVPLLNIAMVIFLIFPSTKGEIR